MKKTSIFELRDWQKEAFNAIQRYKGAFISSHRRSGKSQFFAWLGLRFLVMPSAKQEWMLICAPSQTQATDTVGTAIINLATEFNIPARMDKVRGFIETPFMPNRIRLANSRQGFSHLRGYRWNSVLLDEIGELKSEAHHLISVLLPALSDRLLSHLIVAGTPPDSYSSYLDIKEFMRNSGYPILEYPLSRTGLLTKEQVKPLLGDMAAYEREFELKLVESTAITPLLSMQRYVTLAEPKTHQPEFLFTDDEPVLGMDLGIIRDKSVATIRRYNEIYMQVEVESQFSNPMDRLKDVCDRVSRLAIREQVRILNFDRGNYGALVEEQLIEAAGENFQPIGVNFGSAVGPDGLTARNDMAFKTLLFCRHPETWINKSLCTNYPQLGKELQMAEVKLRNNRCILEDKPLIARKLGCSPDHLDSMMLTFHGFSLPDSAYESYTASLN